MNGGATNAREGGPVIDQNDLQSFHAVFVAHHERVLRLAYLLCGDRERAADATAEAFARTFPRWRAGAVDDVAAYLRTTVTNEVRGLGRRDGMRARHDVRLRAVPDLPPPALDATAAERSRVLHALDALPADQRATLVLRFYEDLTEPATAALLGVPLGTVKSRTTRALRRLRELLEDTDG